MNNKRQATIDIAQVPTLKEVEECPECDSTDIVENWKDGTNVCRSCGYVVQQSLYDQGEEWRTFEEDGEDDLNRAGPSGDPLLENDEATGVGKKRARNEGAFAVKVIRARNRQKQCSADRAMIEATSTVDDMCERLSLTQTMSSVAKELFKKYYDHLTLRADEADLEDLIRYRSLRADECKAIAVSSVFLACRLQNAPRTFKEICAIAKVTKKIIGRTVKLMEQHVQGAKSSNLAETGDFIARWCALLALSRRIMRASNELAKAVKEKKGIYGRPYTTIAATAIYVVTQLAENTHKKSQEEVGKVAGVATDTIRKTYRLMYPYIAGAIPKEFEDELRPSRLLKPRGASRTAPTRKRKRICANAVSGSNAPESKRSRKH